MNRKNLLIFVSVIIILIGIFLVKQFSISSKSYKHEILGKVSDIRSVGRGNAYTQVKFKNAKEFNELCVLYIGTDNQEDLKIGDSIYKPQNSYDYQVYRQDSDGKYHFYKTLRNKHE